MPLAAHHPRLQPADFIKLANGAVAGFRAVSKAVADTGLDHQLQELIKIRASQINGCAYCLQMHAADARRYGMSEDRLQLIAAWPEAPVFSDRERAALALTEAITRIHEAGVPDDIFADAQAHFSEAELAAVVSAITVINAWNRIAVTFRYPPQLTAPKELANA